MGLIGTVSTAFSFFSFVFVTGAIVAVSTLAVAIVLLSNFTLNTFSRVYSPTVTNDALLHATVEGDYYYRICNGSVLWECVACGQIIAAREQNTIEDSPGSKFGSSGNTSLESSSSEMVAGVSPLSSSLNSRSALALATSTFNPRESGTSPKDCTCVSYNWQNCPTVADFGTKCAELANRVQSLAEITLAGGIVGIVTSVVGVVLIVTVFKLYGIDKFEDHVLLGSLGVILPFSGGSLACFVIAIVRMEHVLSCSDCCTSATIDPVQGTSLANQGFTFTASVRNSYFVGLAFNAFCILFGVVLLLVGVDYKKVCCSCSCGRGSDGKKKGTNSNSSGKAHQYLEKE